MVNIPEKVWFTLRYQRATPGAIKALLMHYAWSIKSIGMLYSWSKRCHVNTRACHDTSYTYVNYSH